MATTVINGELILDQTSGLQDDDVLVTDLSADFLAYINTLGVNLDYANDVGGAAQDGLVQVTPSVGESVVELEFAPMTNVAILLDDNVTPMTALDGTPLYMSTVEGGSGILVTAGIGGRAVAAFWITPDATNENGDVEMITFEALTHPDANNPDDSVDFSDALKVRVLSETTTPIGDDINAEDDGPSIVANGTEPNLTTDDTDIPDSDSNSFAGGFTADPGTDGLGATGGITYALNTPGGDSGLIATASGEAIILSKDIGTGDIVGTTEVSDEVAFRVHVDAAGVVTLSQFLAIRHDPDTGPDQQVSLAPDLVSLTATITDTDGDSDDDVALIGDNLFLKDDAPSMEAGGDIPTVSVDETNLNTTATESFAGNFTGVTGNDTGGSSGTTYALNTSGAATGILDTATGQPVTLALVAGVIEARNSDGDLVFKVTVAANGDVTLDQSRAVEHADDTNPNDVVSLVGAGLITLTATITDGDADEASDELDITESFQFVDDAPAITVPSSNPDDTNPVEIANTVGAIGQGDLGWDIGNDLVDYANGGTDFATGPTLTGFVGDAPGSAITNAVVTATGEDENSASFDFTFNYDKDPITAGVQTGTAGGTLTFDKNADTFEIELTDIADGFSFSVLHSSELQAKAPTGNTGHPLLVVTQLDPDSPGAPPDGFFVQFTANSLTANGPNSTFGFNATGDGSPVAGDTAFNAGQLISNNLEDWVSATQTTNGVAGDTIQKGELLTLRFFGENILGDVNPGAPGGGTEKVTPTTTADGLVVKFDGIGNSEDLIVVLDLISADGLTRTTRAINVQNSDLVKGNANVPPPYNTEFTLDNNDALLILEANDYNDGTENFQIQGVQIMQSANGLTGQAINLNGAVGDPAGDSSTTTGLTAWDPTDNDVLKITDIGFVQTSSGTLDAHLNFNMSFQDGDGDVTGTQNISALVSQDFVI
jgi:hypothetical protein